jgi:hypothetical protein
VFDAARGVFNNMPFNNHRVQPPGHGTGFFMGIYILELDRGRDPYTYCVFNIWSFSTMTHRRFLLLFLFYDVFVYSYEKETVFL